MRKPLRKGPGNAFPHVKGKLIGYARVSTDEQELRLQIDALERAGCWNIYHEKASAFRPGRKRPQLELALMDLRPDDVLVVWRLDRLGRDLHENFKLLDRIRHTGAGFMSLTENIDLASPIGRLMFNIIGSFAQFEAEATSQRTSAGIKAAQARGIAYGPKPKLSPAKAKKMLRLAKKKGANKSAIARQFGVSRATVINYLKRDAARKV